MRDQLTISLGPPDQIGKCKAEAMYGALSHPGHFNPADEWQRRHFATNALDLFGWEKSPEQYRAFMAVLVSELERIKKAQEPPEERVNLTRLQNIRQEGLSWLWPGRIAVGKLCVIAGDPGLGKSLLSLDIAAHASRGAPWPDESGFAPVTSVLLLSAEDDFVDTIRPRLVAAEADLDRVFAVTGVVSGSGGGETERMLDIVLDLERLQVAIEEVPPPRLLVVDPISSFLGTASENSNAEIRSLLQPVTKLAKDTSTAIVLISHLRKSEGSNLHRIIGSIAFAAVARSAFVVQAANGPGGRERRLIPVKNNQGGAKGAIRFRVEEHPTYPQPCIVWGAEEPHEGLEISQVGPGRPESLSPATVDWIKSRLREGPATMRELRDALGESAPSRYVLYRHINKHYRWLDEKRGRDTLIGPREPDEEDDASVA
jgi:archaellum biogenesis ATPase FlaH